MRFQSVLLLCAGAALFTGCQTHRPLYYWGNYEVALYQSYAAPQKMPPERQIEQLVQDEQKAAAANLSVNPGLHAQLGMLYFQLGKLDLARQEFETEKRLFPESALYMDRLLQQGKGEKKS